MYDITGLKGMRHDFFACLPSVVRLWHRQWAGLPPIQPLPSLDTEKQILNVMLGYPDIDLGEGWNEGGTKVLPWDISLS